VVGPAPEVVDIVTRVTEVLRHHIAVTAVVLFGSQLTGNTHEGSDIDVAVYTPAARGMTLKERVRLAIAVGDELGWDVELHFFDDALAGGKDLRYFGSYVYEHGLRVA
jgi:predicted nucleotidyltransferase